MRKRRRFFIGGAQLLDPGWQADTVCEQSRQVSGDVAVATIVFNEP
jgi:hypothetical protein